MEEALKSAVLLHMPDDTRTEKSAGGKTGTKISLQELRRLAIGLHTRGRLDEAIKGYQIVLNASPADAAIWTNLGAALRKKKQYQAAKICYLRAAEFSPNDISAKGNLANLLKDIHSLDDSIALHREVLAKRPNDIQGRINFACALREAGRFEEALTQLEVAHTLDPGHAGIEWEKSQNLLHLGRFEEGWKAYEARWRTGDLPAPKYSAPKWRGEPLAGKAILLHAEQGYGDTIFAARFVRQIKAMVGGHGIVILACKAELHRLFKHVGADFLITQADVPPRSIDFHCPLMSLMGLLRVDESNIPPPAMLSIPDESRKKFSHLKMENKGYKKVGIVWSGSVTFKNNENRALELSDFMGFAEIPGIRLYCLQKGNPVEQLEQMGAGALISNIASHCEDFADTAAVIECLDAVVMTDSSVAHLAASMGKPVVNLIQKVPYWLYRSDNDSTPWYPSMLLCRQKEVGSWTHPIARANQFLGALAREAKSIA